MEEKENKRVILSKKEMECIIELIDQCLDKMKMEKGEQIEKIGTLWNLKFRLKKISLRA